MEQQELIPHLFRTESRKITAVLCKLFGLAHMELAEDITSDTFLSALEVWSYKGIPENPVAWLYTVAKNKAKNYLLRSNFFADKIAPQLKYQSVESLETELDLSEGNITDSQLQMLFAICHPALPAEAQIALALRILCGFGIGEIATAFLTSKETINKRLFRAREKLRTEKIQIEFPAGVALKQRLKTVLTTLYLLFSEGYYSESQDSVLRKDFCLEAMRLNYLLTEHEATNLPEVNALLSLMCFHASRFEARQKESGELILYADQDEALWDQELIAKGMYFLKEAAQGNTLSKYHLEAHIAYWHTVKADTPDKWEHILRFYNQLLILEYSPVAALNRTYALSKVKGRELAIAEAGKLDLPRNPFYFTLLAELYIGSDNGKAKAHLETAYLLSNTEADRQVIRKKIDLLP